VRRVRKVEIIGATIKIKLGSNSSNLSSQALTTMKSAAIGSFLE
jgi:hypothetical protein